MPQDASSRNKGARIASLYANMKPTRQRHVDFAGYLFIAPNFILMFVFVFIPVLFTFILSFTEWNLMSGFAGIRFVGLRNFHEMLSDEWFLRALRNNAVFATTVVSGSMILGFIIADLIHNLALGKRLLRLLFFLPNISNLVAVSVVWTLIYSKFGPLVRFLQWVGIENPPTFLADRHWALPSVIVLSIWMNIGFCVLIYSAGLQGIPKALYEASTIDGANGVQRTFAITIPSLANTTYFLLITQILQSFKVFGQIQVMTRGGPMGSTSVLAYYIYEVAFKFRRFGYAGALSLVLFAIILLITLLQWQQKRRRGLS